MHFYPVSITCLKNVEWTTLNSRVSNPERVSRTSEAWAKDWPNKKKEISQKEYVKKNLIGFLPGKIIILKFF